MLDRVRLFRNKARTGHGGAIAVNASTAEITGSSLFENLADAGNGGGIAVLSAGEVRLTNTTVASNVASFQFARRPGGWGGGLYVDKASKALVVHATIVLNSARFAAGHRFQQHGDDARVTAVGQPRRVEGRRVRRHRADRVQGLESADGSATADSCPGPVT